MSSVTVEYGGQTYVIDAGAEFYYPNPQPHYVQLVSALGLTSTSYPAGFTVWESSTGQRLLWDPIPHRPVRPLHGPRLGGVPPFLRVRGGGNMAQCDEPRELDAERLRLAGRNSGLADAGQLRARHRGLPLSVRVAADGADRPIVRALRDDIFRPQHLRHAAGGRGRRHADVLDLPKRQRLAERSAGGADRVRRLGADPLAGDRGGAGSRHRGGHGGRHDDRRAVRRMLACNPNTSATLLAAGGTASQDLVQLLQQFPYMELPVVLQQNGSCWMPSDQTHTGNRSTSSCNTPDQTITFNAWLGALRPPHGGGQQIPVFKSWGAPGLDPASCSSAFYSHTHNVLLPTTTFMQLRRQLLSAYQGQNGLFFAGGWTTWFDSQEAALLSAMDIVGTLPSPAAASAPFQPAVAFDCTALPVRVKAWLEMVLSRKTERHKNKLVELIALP